MKNAWIIFRIDAQVKNQPIDAYFVLDVATNNLLSYEIAETELSQIQVDKLLKTAKSKSSTSKVIIAKEDPAELFVQLSADKLGINFETRSVFELEKIIAPLRKSFREYNSPSLLNKSTDDAAESAIQMLPDSYDFCSCASGKKYKYCCKAILREITEAMVAAEDGNLKEALDWINKAKKIVGETAEVLCRESVVYSFFDMEKSNFLLGKSLELNPKHPRAHYLCGINFTQQGDNSSAINEYKIAIANYPETDHYHLNEAYNNLGTAFYAVGDLVNARIAWEKVVLFVPADDMARKNLAMIMCRI